MYTYLYVHIYTPYTHHGALSTRLKGFQHIQVGELSQQNVAPMIQNSPKRIKRSKRLWKWQVRPPRKFPWILSASTVTTKGQQVTWTTGGQDRSQQLTKIRGTIHGRHHRSWLHKLKAVSRSNMRSVAVRSRNQTEDLQDFPTFTISAAGYRGYEL